MLLLLAWSVAMHALDAPPVICEAASMKGVVFTEFLEMVEARHSPAMLEDLIDEADLPSHGVYTAVGTYPHGEMVLLVRALSKRTGVPVPDLLKLFGRFKVRYPHHFKDARNAFDFLAGVETYIHKDVIKLYPDAELPTFAVEAHEASYMRLIYTSPRPFGDLCEGLIVGCLKHFGEIARIARKELASSPTTCIRFEIFQAGH
jgi:hypothetical protein